MNKLIKIISFILVQMFLFLNLPSAGMANILGTEDKALKGYLSARLSLTSRSLEKVFAYYQSNGQSFVRRIDLQNNEEGRILTAEQQVEPAWIKALIANSGAFCSGLMVLGVACVIVKLSGVDFNFADMVNNCGQLTQMADNSLFIGIIDIFSGPKEYRPALKKEENPLVPKIPPATESVALNNGRQEGKTAPGLKKRQEKLYPVGDVLKDSVTLSAQAIELYSLQSIAQSI
ncbi:MAG: hypothetical protein HY810_00270 [Candidatus Omnitrophica bacterium]|nr:hypothetical protein [Candidatus Omnitrophota bacterium]